MFPKDVLNKIKWTGNPELNEIQIRILHRGAPEDRKVVNGSDVLELGHSFFVVDSGEHETRIPYHRIQEIVLKNKVIYDRKEFAGK